MLLEVIQKVIPLKKHALTIEKLIYGSKSAWLSKSRIERLLKSDELIFDYRHFLIRWAALGSQFRQP
jgi:hypothetical protein